MGNRTARTQGTVDAVPTEPGQPGAKPSQVGPLVGEFGLGIGPAPFTHHRPGLIGTMAGTTMVVGLSCRQQARAPQAAAGQPAAPADPVAQLKELAALKEQGVLTEEEFTAQKARILGT